MATNEFTYGEETEKHSKGSRESNPSADTLKLKEKKYMPRFEPLTATELTGIKLRIEAGDRAQDIRKTFDRSKSVIERVKRSLKERTFDKWLANAERTEKTIKSRPPSKWDSLSTDERRALIFKLRAKGLKAAEIAKQVGTESRNLSYWFYRDNKNAATMAKIKAGVNERQARAIELRDQGLKMREIAAKMGIASGSVNYYLYGRKQTKIGKENTNGATRNGTDGETKNGINKNILIGVAYSETERFIGLLGTRLGISTDLLRSRLSELLGHSPLR
jgi:transcriptional regulator